MTAPNSTAGIFPLDKPGLLKAYKTMRTIREFEERLHADFAKGDIPQEAFVSALKMDG